MAIAAAVAIAAAAAIAIAVAVTVVVAVAATQVKFQTLYQLSTKKSLKLPIRLELTRNPSSHNFGKQMEHPNTTQCKTDRHPGPSGFGVM